MASKHRFTGRPRGEGHRPLLVQLAPRRLSIGRGAVLVVSTGFTLVIGALAGCSDDAAVSARVLDGCGVASATAVRAGLGDRIASRKDESKDLGGAARDILQCRSNPVGDGPSLVTWVTVSDPAQARRDMASGRASCAGSTDVALRSTDGLICPSGGLAGGAQLDATWKEYVMHVGLSVSADSPTFAEATSRLEIVAKDIIVRVDAESFVKSVVSSS